jgi:hypothetical protein
MTYNISGGVSHPLLLTDLILLSLLWRFWLLELRLGASNLNLLSFPYFNELDRLFIQSNVGKSLGLTRENVKEMIVDNVKEYINDFKKNKNKVFYDASEDEAEDEH